VAITVERLVAEVVADTSKAEKGLKSFSAEAEKSSGGMNALKTAVVGFASGAAVGLAGKAVMAASDLNETLSKTGVVFKGETDKVTGYAQQMADKFGLPKAAVLDAASSFGLLGKAAGINGPALSKMSTGLAGLAADASSFYNVPLEQALGDFTSALSGESEPVKKYGVLMNEAAVQTEALALGIVKPVKNTQKLSAAQVNARAAQLAYSEAVKKHGKDSIEAQKAQVKLAAAQDKVKAAAEGSVPPMTEAQKVQARASLITKGMADAQGDLARTSGSTSNKIREVQGRIVNMAADMGQKALPAVAALLGGIVNLMNGVGPATEWIGEHSTLLKVLGGIIATILLPRLVAMGVQSVKSAALSTAAWVRTQAAAIASSYAQIGAAARVVGGWVAMGAAAVKSAAQTAVIWTMYRIESAKMLAQFALTQARVVAGWVAMAASAVASAARVVAGWVLMGVQSMIQAARMAAAWLVAMGPVGWVIAAVVGLTALIIANWDKVKAVTAKVWAAIVGGLKAIWAGIKAAAVAYFNAYKAVVTGVWNGIRNVSVAVWNGIRNTIVNVWNGIRTSISNAIATVRAIISAAWNWVKSTTSKAWQAVKSGLSGNIGGIIGVVRSIPGKILGALGNLGSLLWNSGGRIIQGLADGIRAKAGEVIGAVGGILQRARDLLPFSPAKKGPFSGRGWTLYSGRSIPAALAKGMDQRRAMVGKAALGLAQAAQPSLGGISAPGVRFSGSTARTAPRTAAGAVTPGAISSQAGPRAAQSVTFNTYYPVAEKQSQTVNRSLQKVAALQTA
jgi:hypothetical protein